MAIRTYTGNAVNVNQTDSVTIANTWTAGDTLTITVNGKELVLTVGTAVATTDVATALKQAFQSEAMGTGYSVLPTGGGTAIPELSVITASVSSSVVTLTADTAGVPFTITVTESTASTGTATRAAVTACTGSAYFGNVDNWLEGAAATTGDDMVWNRPVSIKYDFAQSAITLASLTVGPLVTTAYQIGLPSRNALGYEEYFATELAISATVITCNGAPGLMKLNLGSVQTTATINSSGTSLETGRPAIQIRGTHASNVLNVYGGSAGFASNDETATVATINQDGGAITVGTGTTLTTVAKLSGTATINCAATTISSSSGSITQANGNVTTFNLNGGTGVLSGTGSNATVNMLAGTLTVAGTRGTITTLTKTSGTATIYTTVTNAVNSAGSLSMTTGNMTSLVTGGDFTHTGAVTITAVTQNGGTLTMPSASAVVTTLVKNAGTATIAGAATTSTNQAGALSIGTGNVTALTTYAGNVSYLGSGTLTLVRQYGGSLSVAAGATITTLDKPNGSAVIYGTCTTATNYDGALEVQTGNMTLLYVIGGSAVYSGAGTITTLRQSGGSTTVNLSATAVTTLDKSGGSSNIYCATATATNEGGSLTIHAGNMTTFNATNGTCEYSGAGTITALNLSNSTDFSVDGNTAAMTITTLTITDSAKFRNSTGRVTFTNPIAFQGVMSLSPV